MHIRLGYPLTLAVLSILLRLLNRAVLPLHPVDFCVVKSSAVIYRSMFQAAMFKWIIHYVVSWSI